MKDLKKRIKAILVIVEKLALLIVGAIALTASVTDPRFETLKQVLQVVGLLCVVLGLRPMFWEFAKTTWLSK